MKCEEVCERMPDLAAGLGGTTDRETSGHLAGCAKCSQKLLEMRETMRLLDDWTVGEPSPYFDVRLRARLREEMSQGRSTRMEWFRRPLFAATMALVLVAGVTFYRGGGSNGAPAPMANSYEPGTAVGDLQALDKNQDLYSDSDADVLDDLEVQHNVIANP
jgi:hypothetical protein